MYLSGPRAFDEMAHASLVLDSVSLTTALAGNATFSCQGNLPALTGSGLVFRFDLLQNPDPRPSKPVYSLKSCGAALGGLQCGCGVSAVRLLPSTKGWFLTSECIRAAALCHRSG